MENVYYIIENKKGKFKPFVGLLVPDDDDSSIYPVASGKLSLDVESAQNFIKENSKDGTVYLNSIKSNDSGLSWLSELISANTEESILIKEI